MREMDLKNRFHQKPYPEDIAAKRRERILLILALVFALVIFAIFFTLLRCTLAQKPAVSESAVAAAAAPSPSPDGQKLPRTGDGLLVTFLDVGQGDCIFLRSPNGKTMLVDGGPDGSYPAIDRYLTSLGVAGLDVVVASHLHADHIGGLIQLVDVYAVGDFYYPPFDATSETYFELLDALNESQAAVHQPLAGKDTMIPWDDSVEVRILAPYDTIYKDFNDTSYMIRVKYGNTAILLAGDATQTSEKLALKAQPNHLFRADVLKVAHHGSSDGTFEPFLDAVSPAIAVISCGKNNDYGHPDQALLDRLTERGVTVCRTDRDGTITMLLDGTSVTVLE